MNQTKKEMLGRELLYWYSKGHSPKDIAAALERKTGARLEEEYINGIVNDYETTKLHKNADDYFNEFTEELPGRSENWLPLMFFVAVVAFLCALAYRS